MTDNLGVDPEGLRSAAADSEALAAALNRGASGTAGGRQMTHVAVSVFDAAIAAARAGLSTRIDQQAADLRWAISAYEGSDETTATDLADTM